MIGRMCAWLRRSAVDDSGLSLTELIVSIGLLAMVLAVAWNLQAYMTKVNAANEREAYLSSEVGTPLMLIDKLVMQNSVIEGGCSANRISFLTDMNLDDVRERTVISVDPDTGVIRRTTWEIDGAGDETMLLHDAVLSEHSINDSSSHPLFVYLDSEGQVITNTDNIASSTRSVLTTIFVDYSGTLYSDSRETHLRNRQ